MTEPETAVPAERDGLAVPALVTGVLGFLGITAVLGLVFGITALVRIHRTGERGRGLAIGGIAASVVWITVLPLAVFLLAISQVGSSNAPIAALQVGNCYNTARPGQDAVRVPCTEEHDGEVLDAFTVADPQLSYPGSRDARASAQSSCESRLANMFGGRGAGRLPGELQLVGYPPDEAAWAAGSRLAVCGLEPRTGRLTGPLNR
ncbi:DUF4190 domain-containing protein [Amycolatopsis sp. NPDC051758]|uniref:DUF4190 domain-containing protein n=1 Tax=Amycolatopsis sp. NPDC051758 TaxID=3363935 RepID=UPI0037A7C00C